MLIRPLFDFHFPIMAAITTMESKASTCTNTNVAHLSILRVFIGIFSIVALTSFFLQNAIHSQLDDHRHTPFWVRIHSNHMKGTKPRGGRISRNIESVMIKSMSKRLLFDLENPPSDFDRIQENVAKLRRFPSFSTPTMAYDIHNCPEEPPPSYPMSWNVVDVIRNWNPNDVEENDWPHMLYQGLCVFDWKSNRQNAEKYRRAELPFVIQNHPDLLRTSERWTTPGYLSNLIGGSPLKTDHSRNNHFMFWRARGPIPEGYKPPTESVALSFEDWHAKAIELQTQKNQTVREHWYFRLNAFYGARETPEAHDYLYDELPIFLPEKSNFFMVEPTEQRGVNCRFGMKGIISEAHHDQSRNFIVVLGGQRRYILAHPNQCSNMELLSLQHLSGRQSSVDWGTRLKDPNVLDQFRKDHPKFCGAQVTELVMQAGDALYLPTFWFHYIVSLNVNYQCNARSGTTFENLRVMRSCGQA